MTGLAQRLVDEGLRVADQPGVAFEDGLSESLAAETPRPAERRLPA